MTYETLRDTLLSERTEVCNTSVPLETFVKVSEQLIGFDHKISVHNVEGNMWISMIGTLEDGTRFSISSEYIVSRIHMEERLEREMGVGL